MEKFIVSARKYRPNNFTSLIGQESIAVTLKNSIKRGQLAHAYLFCGPRGVGKTSAARIFAKTINCLNPGEDLEPCGECESCKSFAQGRSYCIHELDAASNNSVDDIRLLTEKVQIPPQIGKYSVYIIDEVHMLSSSAFNAFLKTLEEPPAHAIFILATTEKHKILPTILSRCQTYDFNRISIEDIVKNLTDIAKKEEITIDSGSLHVLASKADGAMRDALTLFDQAVAFCGATIEYSAVIKNLNVLDYDYYFNMIECSLCGNFAKSLLLFDEILSKGFNALYFITGLGSHLRNLLICKDSSTLKLLEMDSVLTNKYTQQSQRCSIRFLYEALANTTKCEADYRLSNNQRLLVEFLLIKLTQIQQQATVQTASTAQSVPPALATASGPATGTSAQATGTPAVPGVSLENQSAAVSTSASEQAAAPTSAPGKAPQQNPDKPSGGGLSIKNIIKKAQSTPAAVSHKIITTANEEVTPDKLKTAWETMCQAETSFPRLATALKQTEPYLSDDKLSVIFYVGNSAQQIWIEKNSLPRLTGFLQKELRNGQLKLLVQVKEVEAAEKKLYMPQEKAEFLLKNNPELQELRKDLDLDIK
ncbi:MAG: DNA polymerase III subunit gamma/tau [Bacteroidales bacterium]